MTPSVLSRLLASGTSFVLGLGLGTFAVLAVARPDQYVCIAVAVILMATGVAGVMFADTQRPVSIWGILGVEILAVFTLVPLLWTFTVATAPAGVTPQNLWPDAISWRGFDDAIGSETLRDAALTSWLVSALATLIAMPLAAAAAYGFVRLPARGKRVAYALVISALLVPLVALAGPFADQLIALDLYGSRLALVLPALAITVPLATWLSVTVFRDASWSLFDAVRADGATRQQTVRHFAVPQLLPGLGVAALLVFVAGCNDFVLGAALASDERTMTLPATLMLATGQVEGSSSVIAAAGLLWLVPPVVLLLLFPRRINLLLGRSYR